MIRWRPVLGVARAEARLTRRLVRYWVFVCLAMGLGLVTYTSDAVIHWLFSSWSATVAALNPQYLVARYGTSFLMIFMVGIVFLGFDARARDVRERVVEVLESKPLSNLELLTGRYLGILLMGWLPAAGLALLLWIVGLISGQRIQGWSLLDLVTLMAIPALAFMLGLVFAISLLVRNRLVAAILLVPLPFGFVFGGFPLPVWMGPWLNIAGIFETGYPSDIVWLGSSPWALAQRGGVLLAGLALLAIAAAVHPRFDDASRAVRAVTGLAMLVVGAGLVTGEVFDGKQHLDLRVGWREAHAARSVQPTPDLLSIEGEVDVDPGRDLRMDLVLRFRARPGQPLESALFTLNPGMEIEEVTDGSGAALDVSFEDGLLDVRLPAALEPGAESSVSLRVRGVPDVRFAYLDQARDPLGVTGRDGALFILGLQPVAFTKRYVALLPGGWWLPASGTAAAPAGAERAPDFFDLDLEVDLPEGWLAAGPSRRRPVEPAPEGRERYRFRTAGPVPEVAIVASRFESRALEVAGVWAELLVHPSHTRNLEEFADAVGEIRTWLQERLEEAAELGLAYPYDSLTMVEIPNGVRLYGGGWRMDTAMAPPAMMLVREVGFPLARFERPFWKPEESRDAEGGVARAKRQGLERFFENDFNGGNPFVGSARNFFLYQTAVEGPDSVGLNFCFETLVTELVTGKRGYFSAHIFSRDLNPVMNNALGRWDGQGKVVDAVMASATSRVEVWDTVLGVSLSEIDPSEDPRRALDVLTLKAGSMGRSLLDGLGREKTADLLRRLRERHAGGTFGRADIVDAAREIGVDLGSNLDLWLDETDLPGFVIADAETFRLGDSEDGTPRYQARLTLINDEPAPGLVKISYTVGDEQERSETDPFRVDAHSAVEVGIVASRPPHALAVEPYLSLNRSRFGVDLPPPDEDRTVAEEPFDGVRTVAWSPPESDRVVVDDLSEGFRVEDEAGRSLLRIGARSADEATDRGLPVAQPGRPPSRWSRAEYRDAWGKYRHTYAYTRGGSGERRAVFSATLPRAGQWELEYHLPRKTKGTWKLQVDDESGVKESVDFQATGLETGWTSVGTFDLADGEVRVTVSDETDGRIVMADAVRWTPAVRDAAELGTGS